CRMAAIDTLGRFRDRRTVDALKDAYYRAGSFSPEQATVIRCQALDALGATGQLAAVKILVDVLREPLVEGPDQDKQQQTDVRIAAARALSHFSDGEATRALVEVLRSEQDVALRVRAHVSLQESTGKHFPDDARAWNDYLQQRGNAPTTTVHDRSL